MAKRRPSGDGMVRKRDDGRWEGRIVVGHKKNGDPIFRYDYANTQKELRDKLHRSQEQYQGVELTEDSRMTLSEWLDRWLEDYKSATVRLGTLKSYRMYIETYIKPQLGHKQVSRITPQDVQRTYRRLKKEGRIHEHPEDGNELSDATVNHIHTMLHCAMKDAERAHIIARNPTEGTTVPKQSGGIKQALNDRELDAFLAVIKGDDIWYTFATLSLQNGMDVKTLSAMLGHVSAATTLDIYTHITDDMRHTAAVNIDRSIGKAEATQSDPVKVSAQPEAPTMTDFKPYMGSKRKPGIGCITDINDHLFEGRYSPMRLDGKKLSRNVCAHTREECEEKLKALIVEMKKEITAMRVTLANRSRSLGKRA